MSSRLRIIVTGLIAQHAHLGGVVWDYMQYAAGLARLGHDVFYVEDSGEWPYMIESGLTGIEALAPDCRANAAYLAEVMARFGFGGRWAYRCATDGTWSGLTEARRREIVRTAELVVNVSGSLEYPADYGAAAARLAYIDTDPVFTQIKLAKGIPKFAAQVGAHDVHFTFGETLTAPLAGAGAVRWLPTRHPILLDEWRSEGQPPRSVFTTVMSWTSYEPLVFEGRSYGQKDAEFRRFLELPRVARPAALEVALGPTHHVSWEERDAAEKLPWAVRRYLRERPGCSPAELLHHFEWRVRDSTTLCGDGDAYRSYILSSMAEWSVAKHGYVVARSGWFSGRSGCYLAAGRPVVVQDTGFSTVLPTGRGLLAFTTRDEAAAAIAAVRSDPARHSRAARDLAEAYFDSGRILSRIVDIAMTRPGGEEGTLPVGPTPMMVP